MASTPSAHVLLERPFANLEVAGIGCTADGQPVRYAATKSSSRTRTLSRAELFSVILCSKNNYRPLSLSLSCSNSFGFDEDKPSTKLEADQSAIDHGGVDAQVGWQDGGSRGPRVRPGRSSGPEGPAGPAQGSRPVASAVSPAALLAGGQTVLAPLGALPTTLAWARTYRTSPSRPSSSPSASSPTSLPLLHTCKDIKTPSRLLPSWSSSSPPFRPGSTPKVYGASLANVDWLRFRGGLVADQLADRAWFRRASGPERPRVSESGRWAAGECPETWPTILAGRQRLPTETQKVYIEKYFVYVVLSKCSLSFLSKYPSCRPGTPVPLQPPVNAIGGGRWEHGKVLICWPSA